MYTEEVTPRYETQFNIPACVLAMDELLEQEGVEILYDTVFCAPIMENGICEAVIVENKSGRTAYRAKMVVDASGDADVAYRAGAECCEEKNLVSYVCCDTSFDGMRQALDTQNMQKAIHWRMLGCFPGHSSEEEIARIGGWRRGTTAEDVNEMLKKSRKVGLDYLKQHQAGDYCMVSIPGMAQFRKTRRIKGEYELKPDDVHQHFEDSIGCVSDWRRPGPVYEIPYRALIAPNLKNIITAGRIIASDGDAWEVTRVIPPCALTGEAAGVAAVLAIHGEVYLQDVDVPRLQDILTASGVIIHE